MPGSWVRIGSYPFPFISTSLHLASPLFISLVVGTWRCKRRLIPWLVLSEGTTSMLARAFPPCLNFVALFFLAPSLPVQLPLLPRTQMVKEKRFEKNKNSNKDIHHPDANIDSAPCLACIPDCHRA